MIPMSNIIKLAALPLAVLAWTQATAAVGPDELEKLGRELTPVGAERGANPAGSIPEWKGGLCSAPAGYKPTSPKRLLPYLDPFADDKPLFTISAANAAEYKDRLAVGTQELLRRYPESFKVNVYPTRRTACLPTSVYDNTKKRINAAKLEGNGVGISGAFAQIPFPIPKSGHEVMWNFMLAYAPANEETEISGFFTDSAGSRQLAFQNQQSFHRRYWAATQPLKDDEPSLQFLTWNLKPVAQYGTAILGSAFLRLDLKDTEAWTYAPGQRRVRLAPELRYDTVQGPNLINFADEFLGFQGRMDKFDFKLVGKKEMIVPYNGYKLLQEDVAKVAMARHVNPAMDRWELHRVWVVEATLKPGQRHVQKKKVFYIDEDSWQMVVYDSFDQSDKIHHHLVYPLVQEYDKTVPRALTYQIYDMSKGAWFLQLPVGDQRSGNQLVDKFANSYFTPDAIVRNAAR